MITYSFNKVIIYAEYIANKNFISQTLCENKNDPEKDCQGKCQLKKSMEKEEKKNEVPTKVETAFYISDFPETLQRQPSKGSPSPSLSYYSLQYSLLLAASIFHPPGNRS